MTVKLRLTDGVQRPALGPLEALGFCTFYYAPSIATPLAIQGGQGKDFVFKNKWGWTLLSGLGFILHLELEWPTGPNDLDLILMDLKLIFDTQGHIMQEFELALQHCKIWTNWENQGSFPASRTNRTDCAPAWTGWGHVPRGQLGSSRGQFA